MKSGAIVIKDGCDSLDVGATRITRHQMLDQLLAKEWTNIRVVEKIVERNRQIRLCTGYVGGPTGAGTCWSCLTIQESLGVVIVSSAPSRDHWVAPIGNAGTQYRGIKIPAGKDARKFIYLSLRVRRDRHPLGVQLRTTVSVKEHGSDREQLQNFSPKVLVRIRPRTQPHVQVFTHRRRESYLLQKGSIVAECIAVEGLQVDGHPAGPVDFAGGRDHQNLVQRKGDALTQLVRPIQRAGIERPMDRVHREVIPVANGLVIVWIVGVGSMALRSLIIKWKNQIRII